MENHEFDEKLPTSTQLLSYDAYCDSMYEVDIKSVQKRLMCLLYATQLTLENSTAEKKIARHTALSYMSILKLLKDNYLSSDEPGNLELEIQECLVDLKVNIAEYEYFPLPGFLYSMSWEKYMGKNAKKYTPSNLLKIYKHFKIITKEIKGKPCTIESDLTEHLTLSDYQEIVASVKQVAGSLNTQKQLTEMKGAKPKTSLQPKPKVIPRVEKNEAIIKSSRMTGGLDKCEGKCKERVQGENLTTSPKSEDAALPCTSSGQLHLPLCEAPIVRLVSILDKSHVLDAMKSHWAPNQIKQYQELYQKRSWEECWAYIDKECAYGMVHRFVDPVMNVSASQNDITRITSILKSLVNENVFGSIQSSIESSMVTLNETLKTFRAEVVEHTQGRLPNVPVVITPPQVTQSVGVTQQLQLQVQKKTMTLNELLARKRN
ncbi:ORF2 [Bactrocera dorsalis borna-like virus]|nr:ORF2 [Bactrocera dorsalis borna-like virus]